MKELGIFFGGLLLLILLSAMSSEQGGLFSNIASTTPASENLANEEVMYEDSETTVPPEELYTAPEPAPSPRLSDYEIEQNLSMLFRKLDSLNEELRKAKLREPASPYVGQVKLSIDNAGETAPEREYLSLHAMYSNTTDIRISDWYLESYVTRESVTIPSGDRVLERWRRPINEEIYLAPSEEAYLITGESPINASFHENKCTGYLASEEEFYPYLGRSCPYPLDEMKRFANIALDNDECYDFVERISSCEVPNNDAIDDAELGGACRRFIENNLNYDDCVANHKNDPLFDNVGSWRIYFERDDDLWRYEREIIRLMDENDMVIDVIEY